MQDGHIICLRCGNEIDPHVCWCGDERSQHSYYDGHSFVPMGCDCGRVTDAKPPDDKNAD